MKVYRVIPWSGYKRLTQTSWEASHPGNNQAQLKTALYACVWQGVKPLVDSEGETTGNNGKAHSPRPHCLWECNVAKKKNII